MLEKQIPAIRSHIERKINKEFGDWLVEIRVVSRNLGQLAIGQASASRQREEELRIKQRQAEEQSRLSLRDCVYALEEEDDDGFNGISDDGKDGYSNGDIFCANCWFFHCGRSNVEDCGGLVSKMEVENLWDTAMSKMCSVLEDQFSRMQTANHLLLIKDYVSLLGVTLRRYGYPVEALLDVLSKHRDKYHELLLSDCRKQITEALKLDFYDVVKKYLDRLLTEVLDGALLKLINTSIAEKLPKQCRWRLIWLCLNALVIFFFSHAAQLSGIPLEDGREGEETVSLTKARDAAEEMLSGLLKQKVDGFLLLIENVNWMADDPPQGGNEYVHEVIIFLETLVSTAQQILPVQVLKRVLQDVLFHISEMIVGALLGESVKRFNVNAVMGLDVDIRMLESFAENQAPLLSESDASQLKAALAESRQLVNLLLSNHPENFLNPKLLEREVIMLWTTAKLLLSRKR
ncbi:hypothetical protein HAX54_044913 [Datura stramonium]|uniref:Exocyst complex subunit EXOC6/Sec15 C-terminal domain-containing protein n=1 Tax=Datura stramonium TaxID=4076 RepID=A0ABS8SQ70_DATST|nr:hypothetical protein [Datura stramonium]